MTKKIIGIVGWKTDENSFGVTIPYLEYANLFGDARIISPSLNLPKDLDAIILPGGPDISPNRYGYLPDLRTGKPCPFREHFDVYRLPEAIERGIAIFGICRGFQSLNVHFKGILTQDMYHETNPSNDREKRVHELIFNHNQNLVPVNQFISNKKAKYEVNSIHHQSVDLHGHQLASSLEWLAKHKDQSVEAFVHRSLPIAGVQYHPEELFDTFSRNLFEFILEKSEKLRTKTEHKVLQS